MHFHRVQCICVFINDKWPASRYLLASSLRFVEENLFNTRSLSNSALITQAILFEVVSKLSLPWQPIAGLIQICLTATNNAFPNLCMSIRLWSLVKGGYPTKGVATYAYLTQFFSANWRENMLQYHIFPLLSYSQNSLFLSIGAQALCKKVQGCPPSPTCCTAEFLFQSQPPVPSLTLPHNTLQPSPIRYSK